MTTFNYHQIVSVQLMDANSQQVVVNIINDAKYNDPSTHYTSSEFAGMYAFMCQEDSEYGHSRENHDPHLDIIREAGAEFDQQVALDYAADCHKRSVVLSAEIEC